MREVTQCRVLWPQAWVGDVPTWDQTVLHAQNMSTPKSPFPAGHHNMQQFKLLPSRQVCERDMWCRAVKITGDREKGREDGVRLGSLKEPTGGDVTEQKMKRDIKESPLASQLGYFDVAQSDEASGSSRWPGSISCSPRRRALFSWEPWAPAGEEPSVTVDFLPSLPCASCPLAHSRLSRTSSPHV
ncbi:hypothetical protein AGIG_G14701 [Arapaima gigas]